MGSAEPPDDCRPGFGSGQRGPPFSEALDPRGFSEEWIEAPEDLRKLKENTGLLHPQPYQTLQRTASGCALLRVEPPLSEALDLTGIKGSR